MCWAYESHTDLIARELGIDPLEIRRKNLLRDGRPQATGTIMKDAAIDKVLDRIAERMNWNAPFDRGTGTRKRGRRLAIGFKASISPTTSGDIVNVSADGSVVIYVNTIDMGQGSDTALAQIAAEVLAVPTASVRVVHPDTDVTPYDMATLGSRSTFHMGNAVRRAAEDARRRRVRLRERPEQLRGDVGRDADAGVAHQEADFIRLQLFVLRMIFSENRCPSPIGVEDMLFGIMLSAPSPRS